MTLIDDYLDESTKYRNKYGDNTIVLMQVGHFYEAYAVDNETEKVNADNLYKLSDCLNILLTRKNKSIIENSRGNPLMIGVNIYSIEKYVQILLNNHFTIVLIDQVSPPPHVKRAVTNIYSPGTNIQFNNVGETNNLVAIYIEEIEQKQKYQTNFCCGIAQIDLATGKNIVYETFSRKDDNGFALDELFKFIQVYDPKEIILVKKGVSMPDSKLFSLLHLSERIVHVKSVDEGECDPNFFNINYQAQFLGRVFNECGLLNPIEFVGMENMPFALNAYIFLLQFAYEHSEQIIKSIQTPCRWEVDRHLSLTNNTINQLNLVANPSLNCKTKFNSLFAVINNTSTTIGKRYLRDKLLNPIVDSKALNNQYDLIDYLCREVNEVPMFKLIEKLLNKIVDLERVHRKMSLGMLHPADLNGIVNSYESVLGIFSILNSDLDSISISISNSNSNSILQHITPTNNELVEFNALIECIKTDFCLDECVKYHQDKITGRIFNEKVVEQLDEILDKIQSGEDVFDQINHFFSLKIDDKANGKLLKLEHNDRDGFYLSTTHKRGVILKKALSNMPQLRLLNGSEIKNDFEFKNPTKTATKIVSPYLKGISNMLVATTEKLKAVSKQRFIARTDYYSKKYLLIMNKIALFVGEIDVVKSACKTKTLYGYTRPTIYDDGNNGNNGNNGNKDSFLVAKNIRHPIIERLGNDHEYIANDIAIGLNEENDKLFDSMFSEEDSINFLNKSSFYDTKGILLFGTNAAGKSSLMKAVGLNIIMAQSGMFVPCRSFVFKPYHKLFTRINNNDNIFKGESSFAVEMSELRSILKRADRNSLILGDELCAGTESVSALSIFSASVAKLVERFSSFIFATHLHELCNIQQVMSLSLVKMFHLKVVFNSEEDMLIYDRKLEPGSGEAVYGLEVCKAMKMDTDFIRLSEEIRKELMGVKANILDTKQSKYNSDVFVHLCEVCNNDAEDVHHIKFQCTADSNKMIDGAIQKDTKSNLVSLCKSCHNKVHHGGIDIFGYKMTSNGVALDWVNVTEAPLDTNDNANDNDVYKVVKSTLGTKVEVKTKGKKKKYSTEQIETIINVNRDHKTSKKAICDYLESKHGIKISTSTMNKIVKGDY